MAELFRVCHAERQACFPHEMMALLRERFQDAEKRCENRWCQEHRFCIQCIQCIQFYSRVRGTLQEVH